MARPYTTLMRYGTVVRYEGTVVRWYGGTVVRWHGGTVVRWYGGTVRVNGGTVVGWDGGSVFMVVRSDGAMVRDAKLHDATRISTIWYHMRWNGRAMVQYQVYKTGWSHENIEPNSN